MIDIKNLIGLKVCCYKNFIKNRCTNLITLINVSMLYNFGLTIYNYSYNIGYNSINTILYMDDVILASLVYEAFQLAFLIMGICIWIAISDLIIELLQCKHKDE